MNTWILLLILVAVSGVLGGVVAFPNHAKFLHGESDSIIEGRYLAQLLPSCNISDLLFLTEIYSADFTIQIDPFFKAFSARLNDSSLVQLLEENNLLHVEPDQLMHPDRVPIINPCPATLTGVSWGEARIVRTNPDANICSNCPQMSMKCSLTAGSSSDLYILDTGIQLDNVDFEPNRAEFGFNAYPGSSNQPCGGHGTGVASAAGGNFWGIAKGSRLISVKVGSETVNSECSGTTAGIIRGIEYSVQSAKGNSMRTSIINLSFGGEPSTIFDNAVNAAIDAGLFFIQSAGNENTDSCNRLGGKSRAIRVGASSLNNQQWGVPHIDTRAYFSNYGPCVAIYAPGTNIVTAWAGTRDTTTVWSGTSVASPFVAGVAAATLCGRSDYWCKPYWWYNQDDLRTYLTETALQNMISMNCDQSSEPWICQNTPNRLLYKHICPQP